MAGSLKHILSGLKENDQQIGQVFFPEVHFHQMLRIERKRTERTVVPFLLMLVNLSGLTEDERQANVQEIKSILETSLRETDIKGWYEEEKIMGVIFTIMHTVDERAKKRIFQKISQTFHMSPNEKLFRKIRVSFHVYPEHLDKDTKNEGNIFDDNLYPDQSGKKIARKGALTVKRSIDIVLSSIGLVCFSPLLAAIAVAIKATSPGPVLFRQERMGFNGKRFMFLKFRSMYADNDPRSHREYVSNLIKEGKNGNGEGNSKGNGNGENGVYKITDDPRVTPFGRFLRKSSLDELPQFINVLKGEMSLVGPRPPIPYETDMYDIWHRRRLLSCKPGITGLWQVTGRSTTTFDEMVRLDLAYIEKWSLWKDLVIILKTPGAILFGKGAY